MKPLKMMTMTSLPLPDPAQTQQTNMVPIPNMIPAAQQIYPLSSAANSSKPPAANLTSNDKQNRRFLVIVTIVIFAVHFFRVVYVIFEDMGDTTGYYLADPPNNSVAAIAIADLAFEVTALLAIVFVYIGIIQRGRLSFMKMGLVLGWISIAALTAVHSAEAESANANLKTIPLRLEKYDQKITDTYRSLLGWLKGRMSICIMDTLFDMITWGFIMINGGSMLYHNTSERIGGLLSFFKKWNGEITGFDYYYIGVSMRLTLLRL